MKKSSPDPRAFGYYFITSDYHYNIGFKFSKFKVKSITTFDIIAVDNF